MLVRRFEEASVAGEKHRAYASSLGIPLARSRVGFDVKRVEYFSQMWAAASFSDSDIRVRQGLPRRFVFCLSTFVRRKMVDLVIEATVTPSPIVNAGCATCTRS